MQLQRVDELVEFYASTIVDHTWLLPGHLASFKQNIFLRNGALAMCTEQGAVDIVSSGLDVEERST